MTQTPDAGTQAPPRNGLDDLFGRLRSSGYFRDTERRWFGGVCAGLAARFGVDPLLIRAAAIILAFAGGLGLTIYLVLWLLLPDRSGDLLAERALRRGDAWPVVLLVVTAFVIIGGIVSLGQNGGWGGSLWVLVPIAIVVWFVVEKGRGGADTWAPPPGAPPPVDPAGTPAGVPADPTRPAAASAAPTPPPPGGTPMSAPPSAYRPSTPPPGPSAPPRYGTQPPYRPTPYGGSPTPPGPPRPVAPPPPPAPRRRRPNGFVGLMSLGLAIALFGIGVALDGPLDFPGVPPVLGFILALVGVSVVALVLGLSGRAGGFTSFLVIALGFLLLTSAAASRIDVADGVGNRTWTPVASSSTASFDLGAGDATLDLNRLRDAVGTTPMRVDAHVGAGTLTILVPEDLTTRVNAHVGIGEITVPGGSAGGLQQSGTDRSLSTTIGAGGALDVIVTADVGLGQITIQEQ